MVALRLPDRLREIDLHVTSSMLAPIVEVTQKPCHALESIRITVETHSGPSILVRNAFLGGSAPHLREIKLDGIAFPFPEIRQVLLSTKNLVELHLSNIPNEAYFSPSDLVTGLSTSIQLERLTVNFHSPASSPLPSMTRSPSQRNALPYLIFLEFHCESEYLEEFVAQMELPSLSNVAIKLFNDIFFEIPLFSKLIPCLNAPGSPAWAIVTHNVDSVNVLFSRKAWSESSDPETRSCFVETSCRRLDWQLSFTTQITSQLSPHLSSVHSLSIRGDHGFPTGQEDVDPTQWLEAFQPFTHVNHLYVLVDRLVPCIMQALVTEDMTAEVLPELTLLHMNGFDNLCSTSPSLGDAATQFVARRKLSGRNVTLSSS